MTSITDILNVTKAMVEEAEFSFLITQNESGAADTRLMQHYDPEEGLIIWFGASPRSRKVGQIRADDRAAVALQQADKPAYVVLQGRAYLDDDLDRRQKYWREDWTAFFPDGPTGDDYILIKFVPARLELMHFAQEIAPEPYGLKPAVLIRTADGWEQGE